MRLTRLLRFGQNKEYSAAALFSLLSVIVLHLIHWLAAPAVMTMSMDMHDHHNHTVSSNGVVWMELTTVAVVAFSGLAIVMALRQLYSAMKMKQKTVHTYLCSAISFISIIAGCYTFIMM